MSYITFALLLNEHGLIVFNISFIYSKCKSHFTPKSVINKPQAEVKVNSCLYSSDGGNELQILTLL